MFFLNGGTSGCGKKLSVSVVNQIFISGFQCLSCFLLLIPLSCPSSSSPQALSYAGGYGKLFMPRVIEKEIVQEDGSVVKRLDSIMTTKILIGHLVVNREAWCDCTLSFNHCYSNSYCAALKVLK